MEPSAGAEAPLKLSPDASAEDTAPPWKLLIVDDEPEVHSVTRLALSDFRFDGRGLEFISAHSGAEAKSVLANDPEIAVMLLDVVMETDDAGLQVVQYLRQTLGNNFMRVILRTGHPGMAPERRVIQAYDINDYRAKTELTQDRMFSLMYTSLAAYQRLSTLALSRRFMRTLADEYKSVLERIAGRLGTPAEALKQASQEVQRSAILQQDERSRQALEVIDEQCAQIGDAVQALQRLGSLSTADEAPQLFDANSALREAMRRLDGLRQARGARLQVAELPRIHGYPHLFIDLLEHLLRNAIEHQPGDAPSVEVAVQARGKDWQITVADRGPGVPPDRAEEIFEAFSQLAPGSDRPTTGIGLAVCRKIVSLHGGKMWLEPRPGGGTLFHFTIPAGGALHGGG